MHEPFLFETMHSVHVCSHGSCLDLLFVLVNQADASLHRLVVALSRIDTACVRRRACCVLKNLSKKLGKPSVSRPISEICVALKHDACRPLWKSSSWWPVLSGLIVVILMLMVFYAEPLSWVQTPGCPFHVVQAKRRFIIAFKSKPRTKLRLSPLFSALPCPVWRGRGSVRQKMRCQRLVCIRQYLFESNSDDSWWACLVTVSHIWSNPHPHSPAAIRESW